MVNASHLVRWAACAVAVAVVCRERAAAQADVLYDVADLSTNAVGVFDDNIMADDVHIQRPAVIKRIDMLLAIAGAQKCALWVFGQTNQDALCVIPFTNRPAAHKYDVWPYSFDISAEVPRDFYVGVSAQGAGWGAYNSDSVYGGTNVAVGIAGNFNRFYYGPVTNGQLLNYYDAPTNADVGFLFMTISGTYRVPAISGLSISGDTVHLAITNLLCGETNVIERGRSLVSNLWNSKAKFVAGGDQTNWSETSSSDGNGIFYRVHVLDH
jgi:hypothetical protein